MDESSCVEGAGAVLILTSPTGEYITYALRFDFIASNNELEYEALITGLPLAIKMGCEHIHTFIDSMIVANQTNGLYEVMGRNLMQYANNVKILTKQSKTFKLQHVPRSKNKHVDALSMLASSTFSHLAKKKW
ncbi:unnamed protein product [Lactuca virosa]|uniref:RNase H type-1 domain-containing protein n=1 Tax=Lactuca virosa TaxID=75947 RepID=A0AAU9N2X3_9ASTR|nr:unnamed protein product [Lactuca virosa]